MVVTPRFYPYYSDYLGVITADTIDFTADSEDLTFDINVELTDLENTKSVIPSSYSVTSGIMTVNFDFEANDGSIYNMVLRADENDDNKIVFVGRIKAETNE